MLPVVCEATESSTIPTSMGLKWSRQSPMSGSYEDEDMEVWRIKAICQSPLAITCWADILTQVSRLQGPCSHQYSTLRPKTEHWDPGDLELIEHLYQLRPGKSQKLFWLREIIFSFHLLVRGPTIWDLIRPLGSGGTFLMLWAETRISWGCLPRPAYSGHLLLPALQRLSGKMITALHVFQYI